jgi:D-alanine-D-alanine ligase
MTGAVRMNPTGFGKVAVLLGGTSAEREVSLKSGSMVLEALRAKGVEAHPFDPAERPVEDLRREGFQRAFIALHGRYGEDGTVQGALELLKIPYTGSGVLASALAMDKLRSKLVWRGAGVSTPAYELLKADTEAAALAERLGLPLMIKPASEGSSIGIAKVEREEEIIPAYREAVKHDPVVIAERFIEGAELTAAILDDTPLPLIRLETPRNFYDYEAKYKSSDTRYLIPCGLPPETERSVQAEALRAYQVLGCRGWGRVDIMLDREGTPYFLEVNTSPGMTDHSLVPMAAKHAGMSYGDLCLRILSLATVGGAHVG